MDDLGIGMAINAAFNILKVAAGVVVALGITLSILLLKPSVVRSDEPINPELELTIKDNKVDTVYVYREKP